MLKSFAARAPSRLRTLSRLLLLLPLFGFSGCEVIRLDSGAPARRHLSPAWPANELAKSAAPNARLLRLLPVQARPLLRQDVVRRLADGELAPDPVWRWSEAPHQYLSLYLTTALAADDTLATYHHPEVATLEVVLLECVIDEAARKLELQAAAALRADDRRQLNRVFTARQPWNGSLPGNTSTAMEAALQDLTRQILAFCKASGATTDPANLSARPAE